MGTHRLSMAVLVFRLSGCHGLVMLFVSVGRHEAIGVSRRVPGVGARRGGLNKLVPSSVLYPAGALSMYIACCKHNNPMHL